MGTFLHGKEGIAYAFEIGRSEEALNSLRITDIVPTRRLTKAREQAGAETPFFPQSYPEAEGERQNISFRMTPTQFLSSGLPAESDPDRFLLVAFRPDMAKALDEEGEFVAAVFDLESGKKIRALSFGDLKDLGRISPIPEIAAIYAVEE